MVVAILAIYAWVKGYFGNFSFGGGSNLGGPLQHETTAQIDQMTKGVKAITYRSSNLKHPASYYLDLANSQEDEMLSNFNIDQEKMINQLAGLNVDELKCVAKQFGIRDKTNLGLSVFTGPIFKWYDVYFSDALLANDLTNMHKVWKKTGLW